MMKIVARGVPSSTVETPTGLRVTDRALLLAQSQITTDFDKVYFAAGNQANIYEEIAFPALVEAVTARENITFVYYGGKASGKSYTLHGPFADENCNMAEHGVVPRILHTLCVFHEGCYLSLSNYETDENGQSVNLLPSSSNVGGGGGSSGSNSSPNCATINMFEKVQHEFELRNDGGFQQMLNLYAKGVGSFRSSSVPPRPTYVDMVLKLQDASSVRIRAVELPASCEYELFGNRDFSCVSGRMVFTLCFRADDEEIAERLEVINRLRGMHRLPVKLAHVAEDSLEYEQTGSVSCLPGSALGDNMEKVAIAENMLVEQQPNHDLVPPPLENKSSVATVVQNNTSTNERLKIDEINNVMLPSSIPVPSSVPIPTETVNNGTSTVMPEEQIILSEEYPNAFATSDVPTENADPNVREDHNVKKNISVLKGAATNDDVITVCEEEEPEVEAVDAEMEDEDPAVHHFRPDSDAIDEIPSIAFFPYQKVLESKIRLYGELQKQYEFDKEVIDHIQSGLRLLTERRSWLDSRRKYFRGPCERETQLRMCLNKLVIGCYEKRIALRLLHEEIAAFNHVGDGKPLHGVDEISKSGLPEEKDIVSGLRKLGREKFLKEEFRESDQEIIGMQEKLDSDLAYPRYKMRRGDHPRGIVNNGGSGHAVKVRPLNLPKNEPEDDGPIYIVAPGASSRSSSAYSSSSSEQCNLMQEQVDVGTINVFEKTPAEERKNKNNANVMTPGVVFENKNNQPTKMISPMKFSKTPNTTNNSAYQFSKSPLNFRSPGPLLQKSMSVLGFGMTAPVNGLTNNVGAHTTMGTGTTNNPTGQLVTNATMSKSNSTSVTRHAYASNSSTAMLRGGPARSREPSKEQAPLQFASNNAQNNTSNVNNPTTTSNSRPSSHNPNKNSKMREASKSANPPVVKRVDHPSAQQTTTNNGRPTSSSIMQSSFGPRSFIRYQSPPSASALRPAAFFSVPGQAQPFASMTKSRSSSHLPTFNWRSKSPNFMNRRVTTVSEKT